MIIKPHPRSLDLWIAEPEPGETASQVAVAVMLERRRHALPFPVEPPFLRRGATAQQRAACHGMWADFARNDPRKPYRGPFVGRVIDDVAPPPPVDVPF